MKGTCSGSTYPTHGIDISATTLKRWTWKRKRFHLQAPKRSPGWVPGYEYSLIGGEKDARSEAFYVRREDAGMDFFF